MVQLRFPAKIALSLMLTLLGPACGEDEAGGPAPAPGGDAAGPDRPADAGPEGGPLDGGAADAAAQEGGGDDGQLAAEPVLTGLHPATAAVGSAVTVTVKGIGLPVGARVFVDGQPVVTAAASETELVAEIPAAQTAEAGFHTLWAESPSGRRSNLLYLTVPAPGGWPEVTDFRPDNGVPGDRVQVVGFNLSAGTLEISDSAGRKLSGGTIGTLPGTGVVLETVEVTLPAQWQSGPLRVTTAQGAFRTKVFNLGRNLATEPGVKLTASSEYGGDWTIARGADNDLYTSWFSAAGDCVSAGAATCTKAPWFAVTFPAARTVARIALRGNREYTSGYDFLRGRFEVLAADGSVLWSGSYPLPEPDRDLDVTLAPAIPGASTVRFTSEADESEDPGLGELEIFGE